MTFDRLSSGDVEMQLVPYANLLAWCEALRELSERFAPGGGLMLTIIHLRDRNEPSGNLAGICVNDRDGMPLAQQQGILDVAARMVRLALEGSANARIVA